MAKIKLTADMDATHGVFTVVLHDVHAGGTGLSLAVVGGTMDAAKMQRHGDIAAAVVTGSYVTPASALTAVARGLAALERGGMEVTQASLHRPGEATEHAAESVTVLMFAAGIAKMYQEQVRAAGGSERMASSGLCDHKGPRRASSGIDAGVCGDCGAFVGARK